MIDVDGLGVQFFFDRHLGVVTPGTARLSRHATSTRDLHEVTFSIKLGQGTALIGRSGSGKTISRSLTSKCEFAKGSA
jgi:ABC-type glutathione transport system ATPase component